ncbi:MAG TPA: NADH-quinone oxidoreductase subunit C [Planctomycetota bacterium]|nr:NADH-quinone oxidoreductase subunit C [Planctomycetota bacterium]
MAIELMALLKAVQERFGDDVLGHSEFRKQATLRIKHTANVKVLRFLRDDPSAKFEMLTDVTCVDSLRLPDDMLIEYPERFAVVYQLTSLVHNERLRVKAYVPEEPCEIDSVTGLWDAANWGEREAYDMFGVVFRNHPDLKRILMPDNYEGHPLRKDYPLKGRGERDNFPKYTEIVES